MGKWRGKYVKNTSARRPHLLRAHTALAVTQDVRPAPSRRLFWGLPLPRGIKFVVQKFVVLAAFGLGGTGKGWLVALLWSCGALLDLCGVAAMVAALLSQAGLEPALVVG